MSDAYTQGVARLLHAARSAVDEEALTAAKERLRADLEREHSASYRSILGREALALTRQMRSLYRRQYFPRWLGGSACGLQGIGNSRIRTPLLLKHEPELIEGASMTSGYMFTTQRKSGPDNRTRILIERCLTYEPLKRREVVGGYEVICRTGRDAQVDNVRGEEFDDHQKDVRQRKADFLQMYPELSGPTDVKRRVRPESYRALEEFSEINAEIAAFDGPVVQYPDELYMYPVGLIMAARRELKR